MHPDILAARQAQAKNDIQELAVRAAEKSGDESLIQQAKHIYDRVPEAATVQAQDVIQTERTISVLKAAMGEYDANEVPVDNHFDLSARDASAIVHDTSGASDGSNAGIEVYDFSDLVGNDGNDALHSAGYNTPEDVRNASDEELLEVDGIGPAKLEKLRSL